MSAYTKWLLFVPVVYLAAIVGRLLAPFVVLFSSSEGWLPSWLSWFQTPDYSLVGDGGWQKEHWQFRKKLPQSLSIYVGRVGWLWRNNMYGFDIDVLGANVLSTDTLVVTGDVLTSDRPAHSGTVRREIYREGKLIYFQVYTIKVYKRWPNRCFRTNSGWKLWGFDGTDKSLQITAYVNPLKGAY